MQKPHAREVGHLFCAKEIAAGMSGLLSTHPPLTKRIRAIDPSFDGKTWEVPATSAPKPPPVPKSKPKTTAPFSPIAKHLLLDSTALLGTIGTIGASQIDRAGEILETIEDKIKEAARDPKGAQAVVLSLLVSDEESLQQKQLSIIEQHLGENFRTKLTDLLPSVQKLSQDLRLPLVDLALPALKQIQAEDYRKFKETIRKIDQSDDKFSIFQFALEKVLRRNLERHFEKKKTGSVQFNSADRLTSEISILLSALAHFNDEGAE